MRTLVVFMLLFCAVFYSRAQAHYEKVDSFARSFSLRLYDADSLALALIEPFDSEWEKARVLFTWVAENIRYDYAKFKNPPSPPRFNGSSREAVEQQIQEWNEDEIRKILRQRKGVCADYSRLYHRMCTTAGIEVVTIGGDSRTMRGRGGPHAWNAIRIDGQWHLIDATWGSGYINDDTDRFVRRFSPGYFATDPELFILDHLPDEEQWQLLEKPVSKKDFKKQILIGYANPDFELQDFAPKDGQIHKTKGRAEIRLKLGKKVPVFHVVAGRQRLLDSTQEYTDDGWTVLRFSPGGASKINVFGGNSKRRTQWLGEFSVN